MTQALDQPVTVVTPALKRNVSPQVVSLDFGNYQLKTFDGTHTRAIRSIHRQLTPGQRVLRGSDVSPIVELGGDRFHVGHQAAKYASSEATVTQDKAQLAQLHLAATITASGTYHLVVSHHSPDEYRHVLMDALLGEHHFIRNGAAIAVTVASVDVIPEGMGAYHRAKALGYLPRRGYTCVIDLGGSTWISSLYDSEGELIAHDPHDREGTYALALQISQDSRLRDPLRQGYRITAPDPSVVMDGLAHDHHYGETPITWGPWLEDYLSPWWKGIVSTLKSTYQAQLPMVQRFLITGGAAPLVSPRVAASKAFLVMPEPGLANVQGAIALVEGL